MRNFKFISENCLGCKSCMLACSFQHYKECSLQNSRLKISMDDHETCFVNICIECPEKSCVEVCPVMAIKEQDNGIYAVDMDECIGCGLCANACKYGGIWINAKENKAIKCDSCGGRPACVEVCMSKALIVE